MSQPEVKLNPEVNMYPDLKPIDHEVPAKLPKVTSSETYLKPKRERSKKQI
jgi:hypothetical protein